MVVLNRHCQRNIAAADGEGGELARTSNPRIFRYFRTNPAVIRLTPILPLRDPLSLGNVEDLLHERGFDITHETVRCWWNRLGTILFDNPQCQFNGRSTNHLNQERHSRSGHIQGSRVADLTEWQQPCAA